MLQEFIQEYREQLLDRCRQLRQARMQTGADGRSDEELELFLDQLAHSLQTEMPEQGHGEAISGSRIGIPSHYAIGEQAAIHGKAAAELGFSVADVIHSYGDVCRSVVELALQRSQSIAVAEYRQLNRCLDNAIASAVAEFTFRRDSRAAGQRDREENQRLAALGNELRNQLGTATLAVAALKSRELTVDGTTGTILERSLLSLGRMIDDMLDYADIKAAAPILLNLIALADFVARFRQTVEPVVIAAGRSLLFSAIDPALAVKGNPDTLQAALAGLLKTAFLQAQPGETVAIQVFAHGADVRLDIVCPRRPASPAAQEPALAVARDLVAGMRGRLAIRDEADAPYTLTLVLPRWSMPT